MTLLLLYQAAAVPTAVSSTRELRYDVLAANVVVSTRQLRWDVPGAVSTQRQLRWNLLTIASSQRELRYDIQGRATSQRQVRWNTNPLFTDIEPDTDGFLIPVGASTGLLFPVSADHF